MAPDPNAQAFPSKRTSTEAGFGTPTATKLRQHATRHHALRYKQHVVGLDASFVCQDHAVVREQVTRSISLALEAVGFGYAQPLALESFRCLVEEYMAHFSACVRRSMAAARRTSPVPQDFVHALSAHQLTLHSLVEHLDPPIADPSRSRQPVLNSKSEVQPVLVCSPAESHEDPRQVKLVDLILHGPAPESKAAFVPSAFPSLPSQHTYRATPVFPRREQDPQQVRERATEEGRMGEEALRRLVTLSAENRHGSTSFPSPATTQNSSRHRPTFRERGQAMWKETMLAVMGESNVPPHVDMDTAMTGLDGPSAKPQLDMSRTSAPVNADRMYWRKAVPVRQAGQTTERLGGG